MKVNNEFIVNPQISFKSRKIPRYLYHFTTKANYEEIKMTGSIFMSKDYLSQKKAIFLLDWQNFMKRWGGLNAGDDAPFLSKKTFFEYLLKGKNNNDITVLRIPTSKLNKDSLFIRSQDDLFDMSVNYKNEYISRNPILKNLFPKLFDFDTASNAKRYKSKKQSIEYIYINSIPANIVEKIGTKNLSKQTCDNSESLFDFIEQILSKSNEINSLYIYK